MKKKILAILVAILALTLVFFAVSCVSDSGSGNGGSSNGGSSNGGSSNGGSGNGGNGGGSGSYTVTFDTSLSLQGAGVVSSQTVQAGGKVSEPTVELTRYNCTFDGWYYGTKKWDFANDTVNSNITLKATFKGIPIQCNHDWVEVSRKAPTCEAAGNIQNECSKCKQKQRITQVEDASLSKLEHLQLVETVEATCGADGYTRTYCPNGCGLNDVRTISATGLHQYETHINETTGQEEFTWKTTIMATKFVTGLKERSCTVCGGAKITETVPYTATQTSLNQLSIVNFKYTGGAYRNEPFVNVASYGRVTVSSYYTVCLGHLIIDGDLTKYWTADTYADGSDYTEDYFEIQWDKAYEVGALRFVLPYYSSYDLGDDCYVSYMLSYWDETAGEYVELREISDKDGVKSGVTCELMLTLPEPIKTSKIKAQVTHATRYTPATVYELEVYAKTDAKERVPAAALGGATLSSSGKYNSWASGADALTDGLTASFWFTNANAGVSPWAIYEYAKDTYISSVQWTTLATKGREFLIEFWLEIPGQEGRWQQIGEVFTVPADANEAKENPSIIRYGYDDAAKETLCTFNLDTEVTTKKIRLTIVNEPVYWESKVYDFIPYTVNEKAFGEANTTLCTHKNPAVEKEEYIDEYGNVKTRDKEIAPTCTQAGYKVIKCSCGHYMTSYATDALGHSFGEYEVTLEATSTSLGTKTATCTDCNEVQRTVNYILDLEMPTISDYYHNANGAWAQTFDDGNYMPTYEWVTPLLQKYNFKATNVMSIVYGESYVAEWTEYFSTGAWDLGSHSYNHTSIYAATANPAGLLKEVIDAQYWFRATFPGQRCIVFAAPLGATSDSVADYLCGPMAANRNGGQTGIFLNTIDRLETRKTAGNVNTWVSKADQTEGTYVFFDTSMPNASYKPIIEQQQKVDDKGAPVVDASGNPVMQDVITGYELVDGLTYEKTGSTYTMMQGGGGDYVLLRNQRGEYVYALKGANFVYDESQGKYMNLGIEAGTYYYDAANHKFEHRANAGYTLQGDEYVYSEGGSIKLIKTSVGSYEAWIDRIVEENAWTVECVHELGSGSIHSSFDSTVSKFEYLKLKGVWACSYNEIVQYRKQYSASVVNLVEQTGTRTVVSLTDDIDDVMFDHALTIKIDIPDSWKNVTVRQGDRIIEVVSMEQYKDDMTAVCAAMDGDYIYVDAYPDSDDIVIEVAQ